MSDSKPEQLTVPTNNTRQDGESDRCRSCAGTGLLALYDSPFQQDCPWCGGTGVRSL